jgi:hypothetical protein
MKWSPTHASAIQRIGPAVGVSHAPSSLEFPTDLPLVELRPGDLASEQVPQSDRCDFESRSAAPS